MPKVINKRKVLGGRGSVVLYGSGTSAGHYFYRELIKGTKTYKTKRIEGVSSMDEAETACVDIAFELNKEPDVSVVIGGSRNEKQTQPKERNYKTGLIVNRKRRAQPIQTAVNRWLEKEQEKVDAGLYKFPTWKKKESVFRIYVVPFLTEKGITHTSDITITTFDDYPVYRSETTPLNRKQEITIIKE